MDDFPNSSKRETKTKLITKNGFSHVGALSGRRCPIVFLGENVVLLIRSNHIGSPIDSVVTTWLVVLNMQGSMTVISK